MCNASRLACAMHLVKASPFPPCVPLFARVLENAQRNFDEEFTHFF